ncbi:alpha/beta fold hydrolase [Pseudoalteromonas sp. A22]|uniref:alpha/beta hydrolase n=1 Tax=Pseudoalteromonas TaxID=53246 RepID=UPI001BA9F0D8|nr:MULTISPECIES: alpha/beta fold hydrolase [Pseudoalteromonas]QUI63296.1 alpha/beta fold hydrolase [Pseudoalteromonas sp. A22]USE68966.1 acetylesterase [Pseudoalteromonas flavipulchra]
MVKQNWRKAMLVVTGIIAGVAAVWYAVFGLKPYSVTSEELTQIYSYEQKAVEVKLSPLKANHFALEYTTFDGDKVNGHILYPSNYDATKPIPIMVGVHGMGRSDVRWIQESFKGRDTYEQTDELTKMALAKGYAVIAIDSRNHGKRKNPDYNLIDVMRDIDWWGKREPYENMVIDSVKDHRVLLDWIATQPQFDQNQISVAGYSMGGQISLILAALDKRVDNVLSIVPPYLTNAVARVAIKNFATAVDSPKVWLVSADDDEYASERENEALFEAIASVKKHHVVIEGEHILPEGYYKELQGWY